MKEELKKVGYFVIILMIAVIATLSININLDINEMAFYNGNSFIWMVLFVMFSALFYKVLRVKEKRIVICCIILAVVLSGMEVVGRVLNTYLDLSIVTQSAKLMIRVLIRFIGNLVTIYSIILLIYKFISDNGDIFKKKENCLQGKKYFFIMWLIIFCAYIPYLLTYFPGNISVDSNNQIAQIAGIIEIGDQHPLFHTFIVAIGINIGKLIGNYNIGVAIYSVMQMLFMSAIFSYAIYYMGKKNIDLKIRILMIMYYAFYPVHGVYSITMWKDIPFGIAMLLLTISYTDLGIDKQTFFKSKRKMIILIVSSILVCLFRHNGFYAVILSFIVLLIWNRKYYKKILIMFGSVMIFYMAWRMILIGALHITSSSVAEALSIPSQQFARTIRDNGDKMTETEKNEILQFFIRKDIGEIYKPVISDVVKGAIDVNIFNEKKVEFISIWIKNFFKYPGSYIESFLCNSYGYWYPGIEYIIVNRNVYESQVAVEKELKLTRMPIYEFKVIKKIDSFIDKNNIPIVSMIFSIGFAFWIMLIVIMYQIYVKKYDLILMCIPVIFIWLTCLASPVYGEFRYIYSLFTCLPIFISSISYTKED